MPLLLPPILANAAKPSPSLLILESSLTATCLPLLRCIVGRKQPEGTILLVCGLYPPSAFVGEVGEGVRVLDRTGRVPGYDEEYRDPREEIVEFVEGAPAGPLEIIIDSVDTLCADLASVSQTYTFLASLLALLKTRPPPSRLTLHLLSPSPSLLPHLTPTRLSPSLTHLTAHPPVLLTHLATAYLTPPPPLSPPAKFFRVFTPLAARHQELERAVLGSEGAGWAEHGEAVVEVLVRGGARRGVERALEGWTPAGPCALREMESLKGVFAGKAVSPQEDTSDPTHGVSFNLGLTPEQHQSRARVPLPYAHEGNPPPLTAPGAIYYDPDSADDIDDDDPDEDLDI
ncbi:hypothetical protein OE88DRAFT_1803821 [Heliocybe sulcata]|uniref:Elongator complex protein 5 n=1 Tax=Heliocybe sulcata TaxID=5364 RepID=A0A5C3NH60_9AGAM|nr:hypothetical protein OE88DRAFT_1803821 [Heliocybe sulcata]